MTPAILWDESLRGYVVVSPTGDVLGIAHSIPYALKILRERAA